MLVLPRDIVNQPGMVPGQDHQFPTLKTKPVVKRSPRSKLFPFTFPSHERKYSKLATRTANPRLTARSKPAPAEMDSPVLSQCCVNKRL